MATGPTTDNPLKNSLILYGVFSAIPAILVFVAPVEAFTRGVMTFGMLFLLMIMLVDFGVTLVVRGTDGERIATAADEISALIRSLGGDPTEGLAEG